MEFHYFLIHLLMRLHIFFLLTSPATPLTFDFSSFQQSDNLIIEGDASVGNDKLLHLTNADQSQTESIGRVSYPASFLLRQNSTGKLADFTTHFTFVINPPNNGGYGLVFFLAPNGSLLDGELGKGGSMGLPVDKTESIRPTSKYAFVAVEFDTYQNQEPTVQDPVIEHIGIDVNSLDSNVTHQWNKLKGGTMMVQQNSAIISYDSISKNLSVSLITSSVFGGTPTPLAATFSNLYLIVDLEKYLPDRVIVGFSAAADSTTSHNIISWNLTSTLLVDPEPLPPHSPQVPVSPKKAPDSLTTSGQATQNQSQIPSPGPSSIAKSTKQNIPVIIVAVVISTVGVFLLLGGFIWFIFWIKNRAPGESNDDEHPMIRDPTDEQFERETNPRKYSYKELEVATGNFSVGNKLGGGGFGDVYRGFLNSLNSEVAVKKIASNSDQGPREYGAEIRILSTLRHRNLVQLLGWCHEKEALLVYEFMPNGSLDSHLFKGGCLLSWERRYRIAQGLASVLKYIQHDWDQYVVHRDIKSGNIMLDSKFNPKLGDFGLARFVDHDKSSKTTIVAGTRGYMAPEYVSHAQKASKLTDLFSFGVVVLEIACGRKSLDQRLESDKVNMVEWVRQLYKEGKVIEAADPKLGMTYDRKQMERLLIVGLWCSHPDKSIRPGIEQVIDGLNFKDGDSFPNIPGFPEPEAAEISVYLTSYSSDEF